MAALTSVKMLEAPLFVLVIAVGNRVARWLSQKYRTLTVRMLVAQNCELFTHALSSIIIIFILDKGT